VCSSDAHHEHSGKLHVSNGVGIWNMSEASRRLTMIELVFESYLVSGVTTPLAGSLFLPIFRLTIVNSGSTPEIIGISDGNLGSHVSLISFSFNPL
jgi:hypothetical protein